MSSNHPLEVPDAPLQDCHQRPVVRDVKLRFFLLVHKLALALLEALHLRHQLLVLALGGRDLRHQLLVLALGGRDIVALGEWIMTSAWQHMMSAWRKTASKMENDVSKVSGSRDMTSAALRSRRQQGGNAASTVDCGVSTGINEGNGLQTQSQNGELGIREHRKLILLGPQQLEPRQPLRLPGHGGL